MRSTSPHGGRHELGQNFLIHRPTARRIADLVAATRGSVLEIGAGDGALTVPLARLGRDLVAIELDARRATALARRLPGVRVEHADALGFPFDRDVVVGNVPFHLTTPILRRLLGARHWRTAVLLTQWEVARKRAGVGGGTLMTAQAAPWYRFALDARVPARHFRPIPGVDGGILVVERRERSLVRHRDRAAYERFVRRAFTAQGRGIGAVLERSARAGRDQVRAALAAAGVHRAALPRDLAPEEWAALWAGLGPALR